MYYDQLLSSLLKIRKCDQVLLSGLSKVTQVVSVKVKMKTQEFQIQAQVLPLPLLHIFLAPQRVST